MHNALQILPFPSPSEVIVLDSFEPSQKCFTARKSSWSSSMQTSKTSVLSLVCLHSLSVYFFHYLFCRCGDVALSNIFYAHLRLGSSYNLSNTPLDDIEKQVQCCIIPVDTSQHCEPSTSLCCDCTCCTALWAKHISVLYVYTLHGIEKEVQCCTVCLHILWHWEPGTVLYCTHAHFVALRTKYCIVHVIMKLLWGV